ncbi:unnamed protein product [Prunus brigantina]
MQGDDHKRPTEDVARKETSSGRRRIYRTCPESTMPSTAPPACSATSAITSSTASSPTAYSSVPPCTGNKSGQSVSMSTSSIA